MLLPSKHTVSSFLEKGPEKEWDAAKLLGES
jgi:hypothetical protein